MQLTKSKKIWVVSIIAVLLVSFMLLATACCGTSTTNVSTYAELVDALKGTSEVIKLEDNIVIESTLVVEREVTLDMNGKTISNEVEVWNVEENNWSVISVRAGGNLIVEGNGKIQAKEKLANGTTCVLVKEDKIILSKDKGIAPILKLINAGENLENFSLADRIVGKAVAMLVVYSKIREVYAEVLSEKGEEVLKKSTI